MPPIDLESNDDDDDSTISDSAIDSQDKSTETIIENRYQKKQKVSRSETTQMLRSTLNRKREALTYVPASQSPETLSADDEIVVTNGSDYNSPSKSNTPTFDIILENLPEHEETDDNNENINIVDGVSDSTSNSNKNQNTDANINTSQSTRRVQLE